MRSIGAHLVELVYPSCCAACSARTNKGRDFCEACAATFIDGTLSCPRCALIWLDAPPGGGRHLCGACIVNPPPFARARAAFAYGGALQDAISRWKNGPEEALGRPLAALFLEALLPAHVGEADVSGERADGLGPERRERPVSSHEELLEPSSQGHRAAPHSIVAPVPARRESLMARGFNPSAALAHAYARSTRTPYRPLALRFARETRGSRGLSRRERAERMSLALRADAAIVRSRRVILVDDVITTGATVTEAARACLAAGAAEVEVVALARVPAS